ncbi:DUF2793 domain-containing protein [Tepidicaulis marinus]|uniref:DUF2793 domain-containing protein n=1 Tax=Tepidicaulis marinus TaxID=1333998 RepID=UPI0009DCBEDA|nr:DUF2793 domain-containing protein [Tepidicaulis marinus]
MAQGGERARRERGKAAPPPAPEEGARYLVGQGASGEWAGEEGKLAWFDAGVWRFLEPQEGWRAFVADEGVSLVFSAGAWRREAAELLGISANGAAFQAKVIEADHVIAAGAFNDTGFAIPDRAVVLAVTGRVLETLTGAASWALGVAADPQRYGNGIGSVADSTVVGVSGVPTAYYGATPLRISAQGADFTGGRLRLAIHCLEMSVPQM